MPRIAPREFERLPLRVHDFLAGVPLHDAWAVDLPRTRRESHLLNSCGPQVDVRSGLRPWYERS